MEPPFSRTADFNSVHQDIRKKTQKLSLGPLAPLRTLSNWRYKNIRIRSFIHYITLLDGYVLLLLMLQVTPACWLGILKNRMSFLSPIISESTKNIKYQRTERIQTYSIKLQPQLFCILTDKISLRVYSASAQH